MSWQKLGLSNQHARICVIQRFWGAGPAADRSRSPAINLVHSAVALNRHVDAFAGAASAATIQTPSTLPPQKLQHLTATDWQDLIRAAVSPLCSDRRGCFTFVASDWDVYQDGGSPSSSSSTTTDLSNNNNAAAGSGAAAAAASSGSQRQHQSNNDTSVPPLPLFHVISRGALGGQIDFPNNNELYAALRRSSPWPELAAAFANRSSSVASARSMIEVASADEATAARHQQCCLLTSLASPGSTGAAQVEKLSRHNMMLFRAQQTEREQTEEQTEESETDHEQRQKIHFFPYSDHVSHCCYANDAWLVLVNLKPVTPEGHLLIIPRRIVGTLHDALGLTTSTAPSSSSEFHLNAEQEHVLGELSDAITKCITALNRRYQQQQQQQHQQPPRVIDGWNVVVQQGREGGQTVAHVHVHVIAALVGRGIAVVDPDTDNRPVEEIEAEEARLRQPRTAETMTQEAQELRQWF